MRADLDLSQLSAAVAAWMRGLIQGQDWLLLLHEPVKAVPDWALALLAPVGVVMSAGLLVQAAKTGAGALSDGWTLLTRPKDAFEDKTAKLNRKVEETAAATQEEVAALRASIEAMKREMQAGRAAAGAETGAAALSDETIAQVAEGLALAQEPARIAARRKVETGDLAGAKADLRRFAEAEAVRTAEVWREIAALEALTSVAAAIAAYEKAEALDPNDFSTPIMLARLKEQAGDIRGSAAAADRAAKAATTEREQAAAHSDAGNAMIKLGDLSGARARFEAGLKIAERLAAADPANAAAQRDLAGSLDRLGDVVAAAGDLAGARARFEAGLKIAERLAAADPANAEAQRDLSISYERMGDVAVAAGDLTEARRRYEAKLGIDERLTRLDPASTPDARNLSIALEKLGDVVAAAGDLAGARARFEASLKIAERLAAADPANAVAQRDLTASLWRLAQSFPGQGVTWAQVLARMEDMERRGVLLPTDRQYLEQARKNAAAE